MKRRNVISAVAGVGFVGLAGCAADGDDDSESTDGDAGNGDGTDVNGGNGVTGDRDDTSEPAEDTDASLPDEDPESVVIAYYEAWDDGDREAANELVHENSTEFDSMTEEMAEWGAERTLTVEETETVDESAETAIVRVVVTGSTPGESESEPDELRFGLRKESGDWKLYE